MKTNSNIFKFISVVIAFIFTLQGCKVYHNKSSSLEVAASSNSDVKIVFTDDEYYYFDYLQNENNSIYGISKSNSVTTEYSKSLGLNIVEQGKYSKIEIPENLIKSIHNKNKTISQLSPFVIGAIVLVAIIKLVKESMTFSPW